MRCLLVLFASYVTAGAAYAASSDATVRVEVFTTTDLEVVGRLGIGINEQAQSIDQHVYELNGIQLVEAELSKDLIGDPDQSKYLVLQKIQNLDDQVRARMQRSAIGLTKAMQYGVDRFPVIVFDGQAVVYGVTDLEAAIAHYEAWRKVAKP